MDGIKTTLTPAPSQLTILPEQTHPARMGCGGPGKPLNVIVAGKVMHYVGIGWVEERPAVAGDYRVFPVVNDPDTSGWTLAELFNYTAIGVCCAGRNISPSAAFAAARRDGVPCDDQGIVWRLSTANKRGDKNE